ncbi:MAG: hypothetical protein IAE78_24580 [Myxococcus sp.]|nr:hypothetical protein [Myxococcus sp.]
MRVVPVFALTVLFSCGSSTQVTYEKDVRPLMEARCTSCHAEGGIAPFALTSYEQVAAMKEAVAHAVKHRTMPPYLAAPGCAEYADDQNLTDEQIAMLQTFASTGAPRGTVTKAASSTTATLETSLPRVDLTLAMPVRYTPVGDPDDYRCFVIDWPHQTDTYVTGFNVKPGNARVVHHAIAFLIPPERLDPVLALDAADPAPGYPCYGGPGGNQTTVSWVGSWAPGVAANMYPADTGLLVRPGSKIVLQMHYNTTAAATAAERVDLTSVELALADTVKRKAVIMPWANPDWIRKQKMNIPAGAADVRHSFQFDPTGFLGTISGGVLRSNEAVRIHSAGLHQHLLGTGGRVEVLRADGSNECLIDLPRWDFHWQRSYRMATPKTLRVGDQLKLSCSWNNSDAFQPVVNGQRSPPRNVNWGEGTGDEMCLGILYVSE